MLVIEAGAFGGPEVLVPREAPDPAAGPGQAVVRAIAADVLFLDTTIRSGRAAGFFPIRPPYIPGNGVAGQVGPRKLEAVREAGAEVVLDYSEPGWAKRAHEATGGHGADVVFDGAGGQLGRAAFEVTATGGRFSAYGMSDGGFADFQADEAERRGIAVHRLEPQAPADFRRRAAQALAAAAGGRIRPVIGQTFPLRQAADAHAALEARAAVAKTLLLT